MLKPIFSRQTMGRPFAGAPRIPTDRAEALREAFDLMPERHLSPASGRGNLAETKF